MKKIIQLLTTVGAFALASTNAHAALVTGSITFTGGVMVEDVNGNLATDFTTATQLDFLVANILSSDGDFAVLGSSLSPPAETVTFNDFQFSPVLSPSPVDPLWAAGDFEFDLENITIESQTSGFLSLAGTGTILNAAFDDTPGTWTFSTQNTSAGGVFSFSANSTAVPEPSTYAMFGIAFLGLGLVGYRKRRAA